MFFVYQVFHMDEGISHHQNQCSCLGRGGPVEQCLLSLWQTSGMVKLSAQIMQLMMSELRCHYKKQTMPLSDGPLPMNSHIEQPTSLCRDSLPKCPCFLNDRVTDQGTGRHQFLLPCRHESYTVFTFMRSGLACLLSKLSMKGTTCHVMFMC